MDKSSDEPLVPINGTPPRLIEIVPECSFAARCPVAQEGCWKQEPELRALDDAPRHAAACLRSAEINQGSIGGSGYHRNRDGGVHHHDLLAVPQLLRG